ncbi:unnamed protein product [Rhodiola kirilowii]
MDSLLATYASSDEDEVDLPRQQSPLNPKSDPKLLHHQYQLPSLPPSLRPSRLPLFGSVPPPKSHNRPKP